jgi:putative endonuclease
MFYAYIIKSISNKKYYIGSTKNLENRLRRHNLGYTKSIKNRGPFTLVYKESFDTRKEAYKRERQIKSYHGGCAFKELLKRGLK